MVIKTVSFQDLLDETLLQNIFFFSKEGCRFFRGLNYILNIILDDPLAFHNSIDGERCSEHLLLVVNDKWLELLVLALRPFSELCQLCALGRPAVPIVLIDDLVNPFVRVGMSV
jgi:hypothetical protein